MAKPHRIIGSFSQGQQGPLLFCVAGIHGNEPAGVYALERVFSELDQWDIPFQGKLIGICGNCSALEKEERYVDRDLNRLWSEEEITRVKALSAEDRNTEERELIDLLRLFEGSFDTRHEPKVYVDLHTTSAPGGLFSIVTHDSEIRELGESLGAPIVFNLVSELALTTNKFFENRQLTGLAFESGQHDDPASIDIHEAAIWILLEKIGCIQAKDVPDFAQYFRKIREAAKHNADYLTVTYRHDIVPEDAFLMRPEYSNFQPIQQGEVLAEDREGEIVCPMDGFMLMPLYQKQGEDGFFVIQALDEPPV